ncbi:hypothetical protein A2U01_0092111, partial [Trifolium medium]|nr:hypothetical protein [Trifolium medium]
GFTASEPLKPSDAGIELLSQQLPLLKQEK